MKTHYTIAKLCLVLMLGVSSGVLAEDRALLVGVGKYQNPSYNLNGIDLDIQVMEEIAGLLGFKHIKRLRDSEATQAGVQQAIRSWLIEGVAPRDRVLFYFSGHGAFVPDENGDELDQVDEVLVTYDAKLARNAKNQATLHNVLVDDQFQELLQKIPSQNTLILVDACHSGSTDKSFVLRSRSLGENERAQPKFLTYRGMPSGQENFSPTPRVRKTGGVRYAMLSAAQDNERALATTQGSIFTLGLRESIRRAAGLGKDITLQQLHSETGAYIQHEVKNANQVFHPQLAGDSVLQHKRIRVVRLESGHGPIWQKLERAVARSPGQLTVSLNQTNYHLGDHLKIDITMPWEGYLNVINVGPRDEPIILFPNAYHKDNLVQAGTLSIPTQTMGFDLPAQEPTGPSLVVAFLTEEPINLYQHSFGSSKDILRTLSPKSERTFAVAPRKEKTAKQAAGKVVTEVMP